jgi:hypothetical protein
MWIRWIRIRIPIRNTANDYLKLLFKIRIRIPGEKTGLQTC